MNCKNFYFSSNPKDSDQILEHDITLSVLKGIDLNHQDINGWTTMHLFCKDLIWGYTLSNTFGFWARTDIPNNDGLYPFDFVLMYCSLLVPLSKWWKVVGLISVKTFWRSRSHPCDVCNNIHQVWRQDGSLHSYQMYWKLEFCPILGTRITSSNSVEKNDWWVQF